jgi:hypothetical protein
MDPCLWTVPTWLGLVHAGDRQDDQQQDQGDEDDDPNLHPLWHAGRSSVGPETAVRWHISHAALPSRLIVWNTAPRLPGV